MISVDAILKISSFWLVSVAEQAGLSLTWSQSPEDRFSPDVAQLLQEDIQEVFFLTAKRTI